MGRAARRRKHQEEGLVLCLMEEVNGKVRPEFRFILFADDRDVLITEIPVIEIVVVTLMSGPVLEAMASRAGRHIPRHSWPPVPGAICR